MRFTDLLIGPAGIADLAGVKRQVVTVWRRRFGSDHESPFPSPVRVVGDRELFDAGEVARWLDDTDHGANPDAVADAPAQAVLDQIDASDRELIDELLAFIALSAMAGDLPTTQAARSAAARRADPRDALLKSEVARHDVRGDGFAHRIPAIVDGFYAPALAIAQIERATSKRDRSAGAAGALSDAAIDLVADLVTALARHRDAEVDLHDGACVALAAALRERDEVRPIHAGASRSVLRFLAALGESAPDVTMAPTVTVARLAPHAGSVDAALDSIARLAHDLASDDALVVIGPASMLTDPLSGAAERSRDALLRAGAIRAVARLPRGHVLSAVRQPLAVWLLGAPAPRTTIVTADASSLALDAATRDALVSDMLAAIWPMGPQRAFAIARPVATRIVISQRSSLVSGAAVRHLPTPAADSLASARAPEILSTWPRDADLESSPIELTDLDASSTPRRLPSNDLGALVDGGHAHLLSGTRLLNEPDDETGLEVFDPAAVVVGTPRRRIDSLTFAAEHPNAQLTRPGDVVFVTSPRPAAITDTVGSRVVAFPARVLRISPSDPAGLVPRVLAADIAHAAGGDWRRWRVRRVLPEHRAALADALARIDRQRDELRRRLALVDDLADALSDDVAEGAIEIRSPQSSPPETRDET